MRSTQPRRGYANEAKRAASGEASHDEKQVAQEQHDTLALNVMLEDTVWSRHFRDGNLAIRRLGDWAIGSAPLSYSTFGVHSAGNRSVREQSLSFRSSLNSLNRLPGMYT
jgi:hypothetical protein